MSDERREAEWAKVEAATIGHNIDTISVHMGAVGEPRTYIRCTCGPREDFTEEWEFTDHIRRLVFEALTAR